ncbi:MAG TPA: 50S ribosomal protein L15 [Candidatus Babeliales bacterium]|jgi:large subunit ribosomal protein L15|nr:50S ribosomal protein L15 [Candidatus Babeliales bacterium]
MTTLHSLRSAGKDRKRVGRGGSRGGTSGRGHKGQKARTSGTVSIGFEGGQMPLYRRIPKRGFSNAPFKKVIHTVNIALLEKLFAKDKEITKNMLIEKHLVNMRKSDAKGLIKLLGNAAITNKFIIHADLCSQAARASIEKVGGEVRFTKEN